MITIEKPVSIRETYPLERIGSPNQLLFFDIETTGFSGDSSRTYLIGGIWKTPDGWQLSQWFADREDSEPEVLDAFFTFLSKFRILVHFNGDGFDIPFLMKRCRHLGLNYDFSGIESVDIYKKARPYRRLLGMENMKQKSVEQFLGICRDDRFNGGQLIEVYHQYLRTHSLVLYDLLILHNEDDLKGMPEILPILNYADYFAHPLCFQNQEIRTRTDLTGHTAQVLALSAGSDVCVPVPVEFSIPPVSCHIDGNQTTFEIALYNGTLRHFFENYKDYYYLIYEDMAVHKSVGEYVAREARKKATAKTCYIRQDGCFLPQWDPLWEPVMKKEWNDKIYYTPLANVSFSDPAVFNRYVRQLFDRLGLNGFHTP